MKKNIYYWLLVFCFSLSSAQTYQWQWAKQAGGVFGSGSSIIGVDLNDERVIDIAVDSDNNTYYLASINEQDQNLDGTPVTIYGNSDRFLFSTDCQGNIRWWRTIGGKGHEEIWHIVVDNNGGLYMLGTIVNGADTSNPNAVLTHFDDTHTLPPIASYDPNTPDPGHNTAYLLKYKTSDGTLAWSRILQGDVTLTTRNSISTIMYMDSAKNIHAVIGFKAGTHLNGSVTVPASYTGYNDFQYYLVKFNYDNGNMTMAPNPILLPMSGNIENGMVYGKVNLLYDETLNLYYLAGNRYNNNDSNNPWALSYGGVSFTKDGYLFAFDGSTGVEIWRKEFSNTFLVEEIHSVLKDPNSSDIYIAGRYYYSQQGSGALPAQFGSYTFPAINNGMLGHTPFVMRINPAGVVQWATIPSGLAWIGGGTPTGWGFIKSAIAINGNEIALAKGAIRDIWGNFSMTRPQNDYSDPLLVRLNKDTGEVLGTNEIMSNLGFDDEFTALAVDKDGNYITGGYFKSQLFTDPNDGINTMNVNVIGGSSQNFIAKLSKSACSQMSVEESAAEAGITLYPNPVSDVLHIQNKEAIETYEMYSSAGRLVTSGAFRKGQYELDVSSLAKGVYYLKLKTAKAVVTEKVVKK